MSHDAYMNMKLVIANGTRAGLLFVQLYSGNHTQQDTMKNGCILALGSNKGHKPKRPFYVLGDSIAYRLPSCLLINL